MTQDECRRRLAALRRRRRERLATRRRWRQRAFALLASLFSVLFVWWLFVAHYLAHGAP